MFDQIIFLQKTIKKTRFKKRVVFLDYHVNLGDDLIQEYYPILNWENDINIRKDILTLANENKDIEFIFRGKSCEWMYNPYHSEIVKIIEGYDNVSINCDKTNTNYLPSYALCKSADLVLARPTSLAEECISIGIDVIVMDYGKNHSTIVSKFLPKQLLSYYCHSFEQLQKMFKKYLKNGYVLSKDGKNNIIKFIFSSNSDGNVKKRLHQNLEKLVI